MALLILKVLAMISLRFEDETFTLNMFDSYGDGWNGNTFEVAGQYITLDSGSEGSASVCVDMSSCNTM